MKKENLSDLAAALLSGEGTAASPVLDAVSSYEYRELMRIIKSRDANRQRFLQKLRSPTYEWKKTPPPRWSNGK